VKLFHRLFSFVAILLLVAACAHIQSPQKSSYEAQVIEMVRIIGESAAEDIKPTCVIADDAEGFNCFANQAHGTITVNRGFLRALETGYITIDMAWLILSHEMGHLSEKANYFPDDKGQEMYADGYGLFLCDELNSEGQHINIREAIKVFLLKEFKDGKSTHPDGAVRYAEAKKWVDSWDKNEGKVEVGA